jgi:hypothetical protein
VRNRGRPIPREFKTPAKSRNFDFAGATAKPDS